MPIKKRAIIKTHSGGDFMIEFIQLKQLLCIAKYKTISAAAAQLHISQPALSRSMQKLESELQVSLFDHYKNKIVINENGKMALLYAKKIQDQVDQMINDIQQTNLRLQSIHLASCTPAPIWDLEPLLKKIYPEIAVHDDLIDQNMLIDALLQRKYDIIITPFEINDKTLYCMPYLEEDLYLSVPLDHRLSSYDEISFSRLDGETMLLYSNIGFWHDIHQKTMPHTKFLLQDERTTFNEIVKASSLPSFTSNLSMKREGKIDNRKIIPITDEAAHVTFYIVFLKEQINKYAQLIKTIDQYYDY